MRLLDHAGAPLASTHVIIRRPNHRASLFDAELDDGRLDYELPGPGAYIVELAGVDHAQESVDMLVGDGSVELDARLGHKASIELRGATRYPAVEARRILDPAWDRIRALFDEHTELDDEGKGRFDASIRAIAADARTAVEAVDNPGLAKAATLEWLSTFAQFARQGALEVESLTWVFERVPPDDPSWGFFAGRLSSAFYGLDAELIRAELAALAEHQREPGLLADLLYVELMAADARGDQATVAEVYTKLAAGYPDTNSMFLAASNYDPERPLSPGKPMPEWSFPSLDGGSTVSSAEFADRPYLLDIWASWCGPCVREMASLHEAHAAMIEDGAAPAVAFVALSMDNAAEDVDKLREQWPMPWTHAIVPSDERQALHERWSFSGVPTAVLVDADGTIVAVNQPLRGEQLLPTLRSFIARQANLSSAQAKRRSKVSPHVVQPTPTINKAPS